MDVIQNKVDIGRHQLPEGVEATNAGPVAYEGKAKGTTPETFWSAAEVGTAAENENALAYHDALVKKNVIDLVFTSCRAFPVKISVSMVRSIKPVAPYTQFTGDYADDLKELTNDLDFKGMDFDKWRVEWSTQFTLPALKVGKRPPTKSVNHTIVSNFLQTNSFNADTTSEALNEAGETLLGTGLIVGNQDAADGELAGQYYFLIKYRKVRQPNVFTYHKVIDYSRQTEGTGWGIPTAAVSMPAVSEEGLDIPVHAGIDDSSGNPHHAGSPFSTSQGNEEQATFYVHGKLSTMWGFRHEEESVPSIMNPQESSTDYKKPQSLNICPTIVTNSDFGLYTQSPDHTTLAKDTSNTGP